MRRAANAGLGMAPTMRSTTFPSLMTTIVGILKAWKRCAVAGLSSTFTLTTLRRPANSFDRSSRMGPTIRHGPHHGAQRSTTTAGAALASMSNVSSVAFTSHGRTLAQLPQCGAPRALGRILFFLPQFGQVRIDIGPADLAELEDGGAGVGLASVIGRCG